MNYEVSVGRKVGSLWKKKEEIGSRSLFGATHEMRHSMLANCFKVVKS